MFDSIKQKAHEWSEKKKLEEQEREEKRKREAQERRDKLMAMSEKELLIEMIDRMDAIAEQMNEIKESVDDIELNINLKDLQD